MLDMIAHTIQELLERLGRLGYTIKHADAIAMFDHTIEARSLLLSAWLQTLRVTITANPTHPGKIFMDSLVLCCGAAWLVGRRGAWS